jgi:O-antigen ligase
VTVLGPRAISLADAWLPRLQVALVVLIAPMVAFAKNGSVVLLLMLAAIAVLERRRFAFALDARVAWALAACFAWMLLSATWSERPQPEKILGLLVCAACGIYLHAYARELGAERLVLLRKAFWAMAGLAVPLLLVQFYFEFPIYRLIYGEVPHNAVDGNLGLISPLFWLIGASLVLAAGRALPGLLFAAAAGAVIAMGPMAAAVSAAAVAAVAFALTWRAPRVGPLLVVCGFLAYGVAAPLISTQLLTLERMSAYGVETLKSWERRVGMWTIASRESLEHPVTGIGFRNARYLDKTVTRRDGEQVGIVLHPHNAALEIWLELGLVGVGLFGALLLAVVRTLRALAAQDRLAGAAATAALASWVTIALLSFSLWQTWWEAAGWLVVFAAAALAREPRVPAT